MLILFISVNVVVNGVKPLLHLLDVVSNIYNGKESKFIYIQYLYLERREYLRRIPRKKTSLG